MANCVSFKLVALVILLGVVILHCESKPPKGAPKPPGSNPYPSGRDTHGPHISIPSPISISTRKPIKIHTIKTRAPIKTTSIPVKTAKPPITSDPIKTKPPTIDSPTKHPPTLRPRPATLSPSTTIKIRPSIRSTTLPPLITEEPFTWPTISTTTQPPEKTTLPIKTSELEPDVFHIYDIYPKGSMSTEKVMGVLKENGVTGYSLTRSDLLENLISVAIPVSESDILAMLEEKYNWEVIPDLFI